MKYKLKQFIASAGIVAASLMASGEVDAHKINIDSHITQNQLSSLPRESITTIYAKEGEGIDQFVARIAPILREYTQRTGYEVCGVLAGNEKGLGVNIATNNATMYCILHWSDIPENMSGIGMSIHTHPGTRHIRPNDVDNQINRILGKKPFRNRIPNKFHNQFSDEDYMVRGYLVTKDRVLYQKGRGTVKLIEENKNIDTSLAQTDSEDLIDNIVEDIINTDITNDEIVATPSSRKVKL